MTADTSNDFGAGSDRQGSKARLQDRLARSVGLRPRKAYVFDDEKSVPSGSAQKKAGQRQKSEYVQCNVEVPEHARRTIQALAQVIKADEDVHQVLQAFLADTQVREAIQLVCAAMIAHPDRRNALPETIELCNGLTEQGAQISLIVEMARRGDLTRLATAFAADPVLIERTLRWNAADRDVLLALEKIFDRTQERGVDVHSVLAAALEATQEPDEVRCFMNARRQGGLRGRLLRWLL